MAIGQEVKFWDWDQAGDYVLHFGIVVDEFREPVEEDRYQRLNYRIKLPLGRYTDIYAHECEFIREAA